MPSSCSKGVRKQQLTALAQPTKPEQRGKLLPKVLEAPSPFICGRATTEANFCKWANWLARFHTDRWSYTSLSLYAPSTAT